jgi:hypothetical protein
MVSRVLTWKSANDLQIFDGFPDAESPQLRKFLRRSIGFLICSYLSTDTEPRSNSGLKDLDS